MAPLILMGVYSLIACVLIVVAGLVGYAAETAAPSYSSIVFLGGCGLALWLAWPIALFVTRDRAASVSTTKSAAVVKPIA